MRSPGRAVRDTLSTVDMKIEEFCKAFASLAASLDTGIAMQTGLVSLRIHSRVEELSTYP